MRLADDLGFAFYRGEVIPTPEEIIEDDRSVHPT
jgi:hypothetical protein